MHNKVFNVGMVTVYVAEKTTDGHRKAKLI